MAKKNGTALYLFCFARTRLVGELHSSGVNGQHRLSVFQDSPELCAVLSEVAREDFCGAAAELRMQQLSWVGPRAFNHEAVVEEVMARSPVLPVRFGTLFSTPEAVKEFLDEHRRTIIQFLDQVTDQWEWSVKGLVVRRQAQPMPMSTSLALQQEQLTTLTPGRRYFAEQRIRQEMEKEFDRWLNQTCHKVAGDLRSHASDFRECDPLTWEPKESGSEEVLNWAFLLPKNASTAFRECIEHANADHGPDGLLFEMSGPWPPYHFVPALSTNSSS